MLGFVTLFPRLLEYIHNEHVAFNLALGGRGIKVLSTFLVKIKYNRWSSSQTVSELKKKKKIKAGLVLSQAVKDTLLDSTGKF